MCTEAWFELNIFMKLLDNQSNDTGSYRSWIVSESHLSSSTLEHNVDQDLIKWLTQQRADSDAIDRVTLNKNESSHFLNSP